MAPTSPHTSVDTLAVCSRSARRSGFLARPSFVTSLLCMLYYCASLDGVAFALPGDVTPGGPPVEAMIVFRGNRLSVRVHQTPWPVVLQAIERSTGIRLHMGRPLAGTTTQEFDALPLEEGLQRLFHGVNIAFFYAAGTNAGIAATQLTQVWLWPREDGTVEEGQMLSSTMERTPMRYDDEHPSGDMTAETSARTESEPQNGEPATEEGLDERLGALHILAQEGDIAALTQALFDADPTVQSTAFDLLLATRDHQEVLGVLVDASRHTQPEKRAQALRLLHETGVADEKTVLSALRRALTDEDVQVKSQAIRALSDQGGLNAMEALRQTLGDPDPAVRMLVLNHLIPEDQGLTLLQGALTDIDATVRSTAATRLEEIVSEEK